MIKQSLIQDRLKELLDYNPDSGTFTWKVTRTGTAKAGQVAGTPNIGGYVLIRVEGITYMAHRLAWFYVYGVWPAHQIDHINRERSDNRIANLREATNAENQQNCNVRSTNKSGYTGVSWNSDRRKWAAQLWVNGQNIKLGFYKDKVDAAAAYIQAKGVYHTFL